MILQMRSGQMSIFVCAITVLCPVLCMAELSAHRDAHDGDSAASLATHRHERGDRPHHQHDPNGDPVPHDEHSCVCTGGMAPGSVLQVPSLELAGTIAADDVLLASLEKSASSDCFAAYGLTDPRCTARSAPLLI